MIDLTCGTRVAPRLASSSFQWLSQLLSWPRQVVVLAGSRLGPNAAYLHFANKLRRWLICVSADIVAGVAENTENLVSRGTDGCLFYRNKLGRVTTHSHTLRRAYLTAVSVWYGSLEKFAAHIGLSWNAVSRPTMGDLALPADMVRWLIEHAEESKARRVAVLRARWEQYEARLRQADECVALLKAALEEYERSVESNWTNTGYQPPEKAKMLRQGRREAAAKQPRMLRQDGRNSGRFA